MRKIYFVLLMLLLPFNLLATEIPLKVIKDSLVTFLKENEVKGEKFSSKNLSNSVIRELRTDKSIKEGMNGVFLFNSPSFHQYLHILLIDDDGFEIINMRDSFDKNLEVIIAFFKRNECYAKEGILSYLSEFIRIQRLNKAESAREGPIM